MVGPGVRQHLQHGFPLDPGAQFVMRLPSEHLDMSELKQLVAMLDMLERAGDQAGSQRHKRTSQELQTMRGGHLLLADTTIKISFSAQVNL